MCEYCKFFAHTSKLKGVCLFSEHEQYFDATCNKYIHANPANVDMLNENNGNDTNNNTKI